jgi:hypothetical protein
MWWHFDYTISYRLGASLTEAQSVESELGWLRGGRGGKIRMARRPRQMLPIYVSVV